MWSADDGPFHGKHFQLAETLCSPAPVSSPRPRIMIGGGGERKTLRLVAQYADACNFFGPPDMVGHKVDVLRRHCDAVGRDIRDIEVSAFAGVGERGTADDVLRSAERLASLGVATVMAGAVGPDPASALETVFGPAMERLAALQPTPL